MGALAALHYRQDPRLTNDLDLLVEPVADLSDAFRAEGFEVAEMADTGEPPHLLLVRGKGIRADLLLTTVEYQHVALDRATEGVLSVEDVIIHKLIAWRSRDRDDILSILRASHALDEPYIARWAHDWDVEDRWDEARRGL